MTTQALQQPRKFSDLVADGLSVARYHIVLIAMTAAVMFGWLMTGRYAWWIAPVVGLDWFLINLLNRVTDIDEDLKNQIRGTEMVARSKRVLTIAGATVVVGSLIATHFVWPELTPWRIVVQLIGFGYNYRIVPTPRGLSRFKEMYFFKNFGSSVLFILTCFVYPLAIDPSARLMPWMAIALLCLFFVLFELTYEVLYDLRDIDGDRAEGIPTYPVVHGPARARQIIDALLVASAMVLLAAFLMGLVGVREALMLAAPVIQFAFYRPRLACGLSSRDCILLTHLGTAQLIAYLVGTAAWLRLGLPANIFL